MRTIIIDDEIQSREALTGLLKIYCPAVTIVGSAGNGDEGLELIATHDPQLVFLDVEMPGIDGFEVLRRIENPHIAVVFATAHNRYAVQAFEMSALDYVLKPVSAERLVQAVHKAEVQQNRQHQFELLLEVMQQQSNPAPTDSRIAFSMYNEIVFSRISHVVWIEARVNMCFVYLSDHPKELFIAKNIGEYVKLLAAYPDIKLVHRSHLVNRNAVKRYLRDENALEMSDGKHVPVSLERRQEVMAWLGLP